MPSEEYDSEGSKNPDIRSEEIAKGTIGSINIFLLKSSKETFLAIPLFVSLFSKIFLAFRAHPYFGSLHEVIDAFDI